jgi:hypothetical protein
MSERAGQDSGHDYLTKAADELVLNESAQAYGDETKARELLQSWRWPHGPVCPHCQNAGEKAISKLKATPTRRSRVRPDCVITFPDVTTGQPPVVMVET